ncbi:MAG TPA: GNAT family N-acetyltransferase [Candidatus Paceibacterota bacterium]|nr:GNAT family N-acetyltransferase [Candidatus Paceibacterota bacterium]
MNMTQRLQIAAATPEDVVGITEVIYHGWLDVYPNKEHGITRDDIEYRFSRRFMPREIARRQRELEENSKYQKTLVARRGDMIVGVCRVSQCEVQNFLNAMYVHPSYHRLRIGTQLWIASQRYLGSFKRTAVCAAVYNAKAIAFYSCLGFRDTGRRFASPRLRMHNGSLIPELEMQKLPLPAPF